MRIRLLAFCLILLYSCIADDGPITYSKLTNDDKSHLYNSASNVVIIEKPYNFVDSLYFLLNSMDTITVPVVTNIYPYKSLLSKNIRSIYGESLLQFDNSSGFKYASIAIDHFHKDPYSLKWFEVALSKVNSQSFIYVIQPEDTIQYLDTANVLGRLYYNVYKFQGNSVNANSQIKTVYFAHDWGYLYVEGVDGCKIELIDIKSKMNRTKNYSR